MKKYILIFIALCAFFYLLFAFVFLTLDFRCWTEAVRCLYAFAVVGMAWVLFIHYDNPLPKPPNP